MGTRDRRTNSKTGAAAIKKVWDELAESAFPDQPWNNNANKGKLIAGYITGFSVITYQHDYPCYTNQPGRRGDVPAGYKPSIKYCDEAGCKPSEKNDKWRRRRVSTKFDPIDPREKRKTRLYSQRIGSDGFKCEQNAYNEWRHGIWEFGGNSCIRSIQDILTGKKWHGRTVGERWLKRRRLTISLK